MYIVCKSKKMKTINDMFVMRNSRSSLQNFCSTKCMTVHFKF